MMAKYSSEFKLTFEAYEKWAKAIVTRRKGSQKRQFQRVSVRNIQNGRQLLEWYFGITAREPRFTIDDKSALEYLRKQFTITCYRRKVKNAPGQSMPWYAEYERNHIRGERTRGERGGY